MQTETDEPAVTQSCSCDATQTSYRFRFCRATAVSEFAIFGPRVRGDFSEDESILIKLRDFGFDVGQASMSGPPFAPAMSL